MSYPHPAPGQDSVPSMGGNATTPYRPMNQARTGRGAPAQQMMDTNRPAEALQQQTPSMEREPPQVYHMTPQNNAYDHNLVQVQIDQSGKKRPHSSDAQGDNPRKRASVACNICRSRKSRCDGGRPKCKLCTELGADCIYQEPGIKLDAGDKIILEKLDAILALMHGSELHDLANLATRYGSIPGTNNTAPMNNRVAPMQVPDGGAGAPREATPLTRLPLDQWPKLRDMGIGLYSPPTKQAIESDRPLLPPDATLSLDLADSDGLIPPFFEVINYALPILDDANWAQAFESAKRVGYREGLDSCLVLLVLALGAASRRGPIATLPAGTEPPGLPYFGAAFQLLSLTLVDRAAVAIQCTILATLYFLYLVRPMEAYSLISTLPPKLQLLPRQSEDTSISRLTHATSLLLSQFTHIDIIPDPMLTQLSDSTRYPIQAGPPYSDDSPTTWPFVALLTYNRLYQRIQNDINLPDATQGPIAANLDQQLTEWWYAEVPMPERQAPLPPPRGPLPYPILMDLRTKYFLARLQIFKPYLIGVLSDETLSLQPLTICKGSCSSGLESAIRILEDIPSLAESTAMVLHPFDTVLAILDTALMVIACSLSVNLVNLLPEAKILDAVLEGVLDYVARWVGTGSPAIARGWEALHVADGKRREGAR